MVVEARDPGKKDGVLDTTRRTGPGPAVGREEERKGAWSDRICTLFGRRSCACGGEAFTGSGVAPVTEGGRTGAVTERLGVTATPRDIGAGPRDDIRLGIT